MTRSETKRIKNAILWLGLYFAVCLLGLALGLVIRTAHAEGCHPGCWKYDKPAPSKLWTPKRQATCGEDYEAVLWAREETGEQFWRVYPRGSKRFLEKADLTPDGEELSYRGRSCLLEP
jgi:hypothetical protein